MVEEVTGCAGVREGLMCVDEGVCMKVRRGVCESKGMNVYEDSIVREFVCS